MVEPLPLLSTSSRLVRWVLSWFDLGGLARQGHSDVPLKGSLAEGSVFVARGLAKTYRMGEVEVPALRAIDLDIREGEFTFGAVRLHRCARKALRSSTIRARKKQTSLPEVATADAAECEGYGSNSEPANEDSLCGKR